MKLKTLIPLVGNCHVTIWKKDSKGAMRAVTRGFSRDETKFSVYMNKNVVAIRPTFNNSLSVTVE